MSSSVRSQFGSAMLFHIRIQHSNQGLTLWEMDISMAINCKYALRGLKKIAYMHFFVFFSFVLIPNVMLFPNKNTTACS